MVSRQNCEELLASLYLSVRPSVCHHGHNPALIEHIFMKFQFEYFSKICREKKSGLIEIGQK